MSTCTSPTATEDTEPREPFTTLNLMRHLWDKAEDRLTDADLEWIGSNGLQATSVQAQNLASTIEGLGCLIQADGADGQGAGSFLVTQSLADLLFTIQQHVEHIACIADMANSAQILQGKRARGWAKTPEPAQPPASH